MRQRLSIVTSKPQTTRSRILGILTRPGSQTVFLDTPGLLEPSYRLHEAMDRQIGRASSEADVVLLLIDGTRLDDRRDLISAFVSRTDTPIVPAVNKTDLLSPDRVKAALAEVEEGFGLAPAIPVSALRGENLDTLLSRLESYLPMGQQLYPDDMIAEQPERFFAAELIREAAFEQLGDELPYAVQVVVEEFDDPEVESGNAGQEDKTYIAATLYVERDSQKGIVIGRGGKRLRSIGLQARERIEALVAAEVYLDLRVKVRRDWRNRDSDLKEFGYR